MVKDEDYVIHIQKDSSHGNKTLGEIKGDYILSLESRIKDLEKWVVDQSTHSAICTFDLLGRPCTTCDCEKLETK